MRKPIGSESKYMALETGGGLFAIPICDIRGIIVGTQTTPFAVLPHTPDFVKCVVTLNGQPITIITLPGERKDMQVLGKPSCYWRILNVQ